MASTTSGMTSRMRFARAKSEALNSGLSLRGLRRLGCLSIAFYLSCICLTETDDAHIASAQAKGDDVVAAGSSYESPEAPFGIHEAHIFNHDCVIPLREQG